jgi:hypothetical protein
VVSATVQRLSLALCLWAALGSTALAGPRTLARALAQARLDYRHELTISGTRYRMTDLFDMGEGRLATIAEIERGRDKSVRVFYRSKSQGVFRLLPALNLAERNLSGELGGLPLLDKGDGEEHLTAPLDLQDALSRLGPGRKISSALELVKAAVPGYRSAKSLSDYRRSSVRPTSRKLRLYDVVDGRPVIRAGLEPDYRRPLSVDRTRTGLDGVVERLRFPSRDGRLVYTLHVDGAGHAQIATVTVKDAAIGRFGLPTQTVTTGEVTMPRWEYDFQIPAGYVGGTHPRHRDYASSWNWLRKRPEIRAFYEATGRAMPGPDA